MWISWGQGWYNNNIICHYLSPNVTGSAGKSVMIIKWLFRALNSMSNYRHYKPKQNQCLPGTRNGWKGGLLCRLILERWQTMQLRAKDKQSFLMFGQTNRSHMSRCVALPPGWAILCTVSKNQSSHQKQKGTMDHCELWGALLLLPRWQIQPMSSSGCGGRPTSRPVWLDPHSGPGEGVKRGNWYKRARTGRAILQINQRNGTCYFILSRLITSMLELRIGLSALKRKWFPIGPRGCNLFLIKEIARNPEGFFMYIKTCATY